MIEKTYLVQVKYTGSNSDRTYSYYSFNRYDKGDEVVVPVGLHEKTAIVVNCFEIKEVIS